MTPGRSVTQLGILPTKRRNPWENHGKTMRIHEQKCEGKISEVGIAIKIDDIQEKRGFYHQNWRCSQQFSGHPSHHLSSQRDGPNLARSTQRLSASLRMVRTAHKGALHSEKIFPGPAEKCGSNPKMFIGFPICGGMNIRNYQLF